MTKCWSAKFLATFSETLSFSRFLYHNNATACILSHFPLILTDFLPHIYTQKYTNWLCALTQLLLYMIYVLAQLCSPLCTRNKCSIFSIREEPTSSLPQTTRITFVNKSLDLSSNWTSCKLNNLFNNLHVIDTPYCTCAAQYENVEHFFPYCPQFWDAIWLETFKWWSPLILTIFFWEILTMMLNQTESLTLSPP